MNYHLETLTQSDFEAMVSDMVNQVISDKLSADKNFAEIWSDLQTQFHMATGFDFRLRITVE